MSSRIESTINIHLQTNAKNNEVTGFKEKVLQVRVTAVPHKGEANKALIKLIANILSIPKSSITILHGHTIRNKVLEIQGLSPDELNARLHHALVNNGSLDI